MVRAPARGADVSVRDLERLADDFLGSKRAVVLASGDAGEQPREIVSADGRTIATVARERSYSTPELLALERRVIDHALTARDQRVSPRAERAAASACDRNAFSARAGVVAAWTTGVAANASAVAMASGIRRGRQVFTGLLATMNKAAACGHGR